MKPRIYYAPESFDLENSEYDFESARNIVDDCPPSFDEHDSEDFDADKENYRCHFNYEPSYHNCNCGETKSYNIYKCAEGNVEKFAIIVCCDACFGNCDSKERLD